MSIPMWIVIGWAQKLQQGASKPPGECITILCMNFGQIGHQTLPPKKIKKKFGGTWAFNFHWKVVCPCPGSMEHDSKTCSLACGWAYGCTMLLVAAIIMVKAKHHWNPLVMDTAETTPTATSFCAISIQTFLPRLCGPASVWGVVASWSYNNFLLTVCVCKSECGHVWQPGFLSSWATCLTKLHKAYFSKRFFAPAKTRSLGGTSCNMARSVSISAMLRHLLGTRDTKVEYLKLVTMMMVNDKILAALWWHHHLACFWKKCLDYSMKNGVSRFPRPRFSCFARCFASSTRTKLKRSRSGRSLPSSVPSCFTMAVPSTTWTWTSAYNSLVKWCQISPEKKMSCLWFTCDVMSL